MEIYKIETGNLMLDGGAIFGVVPKVLWEKVYPANDKNLVNLSMRAMLVVEGDKKILIDNGIGDKQDPKFFGYYFLNGDDSLLTSLHQYGFTPDDITDVILTHLHFDHCGGSVKYDENKNTVLAFPNAKYWVSKTQWETAIKPNDREKASFLKENLLPIQAHGNLHFIENEGAFSEHVDIRLFNGHTEGLIVPVINYNGKKLVYAADLIPLASNIPVSWISAYDMNPTISLLEKKDFLNEACENDYTLFFEHDIDIECCNLTKTEKGIRMKEAFSLAKFIEAN